MPAVVGFLLVAFFFVASLVTAIFSIWWGAIIYVSAIYSALLIVVATCVSVRAPDRMRLLSHEEEQLFRKHYPFFRYPFGAQTFAHFLNYARVFGVVWIAIALWQGMYWIAATIGVFYVVSTPLIMRLFPAAHYRAVAEKGHLFGAQKLHAIERILALRDSLEF